MSDVTSSKTPARVLIGSVDGVIFDVVAWGPAQANVDLSVACMFEHELGEAGMTGGLLTLDRALGGQLSRLRQGGAFRAQAMETLLITVPPPSLASRAVLVIGLGSPELLDGEVLRRATRVAMREAIRFGAVSMAFAPSVLDAGCTNTGALDMQNAMLDGMLSALRAEHMLAKVGLAHQPMLRHCSFDVGAPRLRAAGDRFVEAFTHLSMP